MRWKRMGRLVFVTVVLLALAATHAYGADADAASNVASEGQAAGYGGRQEMDVDREPATECDDLLGHGDAMLADDPNEPTSDEVGTASPEGDGVVPDGATDAPDPAPPEASLGALADGRPGTAALTYRAHVRQIGWQGWVGDGETAGTVGRSLGIEALEMRLVDVAGSISYCAHVRRIGWQGWAKDGAMAGTTGRGLSVEAVRVSLSGEAASHYDLWYRAHVQKLGWQPWVRDAAVAGTTGRSLAIEGLQVLLLPKGSSLPEPAPTAGVARLSVRAHLSGTGWQGWLPGGSTAGSPTLGRNVEAIAMGLVGMDGGVVYRAHLSGKGWQAWRRDGATAGTTGERRAVEAFEARLEGEAARRYDLWYRSYVDGVGWLGWASDAQTSGSVGYARPILALQVELVDKGEGAPGSVVQPSLWHASVSYRAHVQRQGWRGWAADGESAGTIGQGLRLEALQARLDDAGALGGVRYRLHAKDVGWQPWTHDGETAGTMGQAKRVEALQAELTGDLAATHDVWYRAHVEDFGWLDWTKDGAVAGTTGLACRLETIQIRVLPKGSQAPGATARPALDPSGVAKVGYQNPAGFYQVSHFSVPVPSGAQPPFDYVTPARITVMATREECVEAFVGRAYEYLGTPYRWDYSCAPGVGVDCIGLVYQCAYACGMDMGTGTGHDDFNPWAHWITGNAGWHSHDANNFWDYGRVAHVPLASRRRGDVISWAGHAAIYLGGDQIIEATTGVVRVASLWVYGTPRGCLRLFQ